MREKEGKEGRKNKWEEGKGRSRKRMREMGQELTGV